MAKAKKSHGKKVAGQSERVTLLKTKEKALNPFELHFNKQKHSVLGQRLQGEIGKPGISKAKALKKRQLTLQRELNTRTKSNEFVDRRIGERTKGMSAEDRLAARFAAERKKQHRQALFNLEEPSELTHMGQTLSEIEKYEDPRSDDDDDDALGAEFVKAAHFGGGLLGRAGGPETAQSRKDWIDKMIAESKLRKYEARRAREETLDMTDKLDQDYQDVLKLVRNAKMLRPTKADAVAAATEASLNRAKTATVADSAATPTVSQAEKDGATLTLKTDEDGATRTLKTGEDNATRNMETAAPDPDEEYDALVKQLIFAPRAGQASDRTKTDAEAEREAAQRLRQLEEQRLLRMRTDPDEAAAPSAHRSADDLDDGMVLDSAPSQRLQLVGDQLVVTSQDSTVTSSADMTSRAARRAAAKAQKAEQQEDEEDEDKPTAPSAAKLPSYKQLSGQLRQLSPLQQLQHVRRLSTGVAAAQLAGIYGQLLRYVTACCRRPAGLRAADALVPLLYELTQRLGDAACQAWLRWLTDRWQLRRRRRRTFPGLELLVPLRLCGQLFPASDRRHPVTMPAMLMLAQMLAECRVRDARDLTAGLLAASLLMEFTSLSGRLVPELVTFLHGVICSSLPAERRPTQQLQPLTGDAAGLLQLSSSCADVEYDRQLALSAAHSNPAPDDGWRLSCLHVTAALLQQLAERLQQLPAGYELLHPLGEALAAADLRPLPDALRCQWTAALSAIGAVSKEKTSLEKLRRRPKPLRLFEPALEEHFDGHRRRAGSAQRREHDKLVHKYKRQLRSTVREVRRDNAFLARAKLSDIKSKDDERRRKLKNLMSSLQTQEGDYKRMKRQK